MTTDAWGRYKIKVSKGDKLRITYPGMYRIIFEVDQTETINFKLHKENELPMRWIDGRN